MTHNLIAEKKAIKRWLQNVAAFDLWEQFEEQVVEREARLNQINHALNTFEI